MPVTTDATIRPDQLETELADAGVDVSNGIGTDGANTGKVFTYDANGKLVDLPDEAQQIVDSHKYPYTKAGKAAAKKARARSRRRKK